MDMTAQSKPCSASGMAFPNISMCPIPSLHAQSVSTVFFLPLLQRSFNLALKQSQRLGGHMVTVRASASRAPHPYKSDQNPPLLFCSPVTHLHFYTNTHLSPSDSLLFVLLLTLFGTRSRIRYLSFFLHHHTNTQFLVNPPHRQDASTNCPSCPRRHCCCCPA